MKNKNFFSKNSLVSMLILSVLTGLLSGVVGSILVKSYFEKNYYDVPLFGEIDLSQNDIERKLIITNPKKVVVNQNEGVGNAINLATDSIVGIFEKKKLIAVDSPVINLNYYYNLNNSVGQGLVVTSDGWVISCFAPEGIKSNQGGLPNYIVITKDKEILEIDKFIKDALTGFNFLHVNNINLTPKKFINADNLETGELFVAVNWQRQGWLTNYVGRYSNTSLVKYSDDLSDRLILAEAVPDNFQCSFLFNLSGEAIGLIDEDGYGVPFDYLYGAINSILEYGDIKRATLGVNYVNIENLTSIDQAAESIPKQGAVIFKALNGVAVVAGSSASKAGLAEGDVILSIDGVKISRENDLVDILQNYFSGDEVSVEFWRSGQTDNVMIKL